MKKQRHHKKRKSRNFLGLNKAVTILILSITLVTFILGVIIVAYNFGFEEGTEENAHIVYKTKEENRLLRQRLKDTLTQEGSKRREYRHYSKKETHPIYKVKEKQEKRIVHKQTHKEVRQTAVKKPKLALILDDVSFPSEVRAVKALGLKINFSFFPVTSAHPQTAQLAAHEPFYMVHLPLEAMSFNAEEPYTLRITDSKEKILNRLQSIKRDFPRLRYMNNHTGSKFTSDKEAVSKLIDVARTLNVDIVDSRTTAQTKLPEVYAQKNRKLFARDVFLDHESDVSYICGQIKEAVSVAKEKGSAIAIGHPRRHTIKALHRCKEYLSAVELVYINEL